MEREHRYWVAKTKDVEKYLSEEQQLSLDRFLTKIRIGRLKDGKADVKTVCVDSDWPEYETVWKMLEARVDGKASPASTPEVRESVIEAIAEALGDAYDCTRVWSAWSYGTMSQDDFSLVAEDRSRLEEIADAAMLAAAPTPPVSEDRKELELYGELLYAVANKFSGESRHQTALRYIRNAEKGSDNATTQEDKP